MATWKFDPTHSFANFSARHMMITTVRGQIPVVSGEINYDPANPAASSVWAELNAAAISTGLNDRDNHLKSPDFLDVANFPTITFKSTNVQIVKDGEAKITGDLTIRGNTRSVSFDAELIGLEKNPFAGTETVGFSGALKINREDWGLVWNVALETGGWLVGKDIKIELDVEAVKVTETQTA